MHPQSQEEFLKTPPLIEINLKLIYDVKEILNSQTSHCDL